MTPQIMQRNAQLPSASLPPLWGRVGVGGLAPTCIPPPTPIPSPRGGGEAQVPQTLASGQAA